MMVLAASATVIAPSIANAMKRAEAQAAIRNVVALARAARNDAILTMSEVELTVNPQALRIGIEHNARSITLPPGFSLTVTAAESEVVAFGIAGIRFFPDGSATGGRIWLWNEHSPRYYVDVDWLTGAAFLGEGGE